MSRQTSRPEVPAPERKERLPWEEPKPLEEDPESPAKLEAILNNPSYEPAVEDVDFLRGDDARGVRIQLDYLKPESLLNEHGVRHTIVVFGSTRIVEPACRKNECRTATRRSVSRAGEQRFGASLEGRRTYPRQEPVL